MLIVPSFCESSEGIVTSEKIINITEGKVSEVIFHRVYIHACFSEKRFAMVYSENGNDVKIDKQTIRKMLDEKYTHSELRVNDLPNLLTFIIERTRLSFDIMHDYFPTTDKFGSSTFSRFVNDYESALIINNRAINRIRLYASPYRTNDSHIDDLVTKCEETLYSNEQNIRLTDMRYREIQNHSSKTISYIMGILTVLTILFGYYGMNFFTEGVSSSAACSNPEFILMLVILAFLGMIIVSTFLIYRHRK